MGTSEGDSEDVFHALQEFCETPQSQRQLSQPIEDVMEQIAKTGELQYPWNLVRPAIEFKLGKTFQEFFEATSFPDQTEAERSHNEMKDEIFSRLAYFDRAPFTVQRLCELVVWPKSHYTRCDKYMRGLTKVVKVVSTIGPPLCNGSSHAVPTKPCNGNSSALGRHESAATSGEASNMHLESTSSMSGEDDTFSSFNLSPRQMPSPYSPPLSPNSSFEGRSLDDRPTWRLSSGDDNGDENGAGGERSDDSNTADGDSDGSSNTQSTVELGEEGVVLSLSPGTGEEAADIAPVVPPPADSSGAVSEDVTEAMSADEETSTKSTSNSEATTLSSE